MPGIPHCLRVCRRTVLTGKNDPIHDKTSIQVRISFSLLEWNGYPLFNLHDVQLLALLFTVKTVNRRTKMSA
jgi:hypothetical protein